MLRNIWIRSLFLINIRMSGKHKSTKKKKKEKNNNNNAKTFLEIDVCYISTYVYNILIYNKFRIYIYACTYIHIHIYIKKGIWCCVCICACISILQAMCSAGLYWKWGNVCLGRAETHAPEHFNLIKFHVTQFELTVWWQRTAIPALRHWSVLATFDFAHKLQSPVNNSLLFLSIFCLFLLYL